MHWYFLAALSVTGTTLFTVMIKLSQDKIDPLLGTFLLQLAALLAVAFPLFYRGIVKQAEIAFTLSGVLYSLAAGVAIVLANFCIFSIYHGNVPISIAAPVMRVGGTACIVLVGLLYFKESLDLYKLAGLAFAGVGIFCLTVTK